MDKKRLKNIMYIVYMLIIAVVATVIMSVRVYAWPIVAADSQGSMGARVGYKSINPDNFTDTDLKNFAEALSSADYSISETRSGKDYQIVRYPLKYDYAVEIVTRTDNDTMAEEKENGTGMFNNRNSPYWEGKVGGVAPYWDDVGAGFLFFKQIMVDIVYVNAKSEQIADINLNGRFGYDYLKQVGIDGFSASVTSELKQLSFSNIALTGGAPDTNMPSILERVGLATPTTCDAYITPNLLINGTTINNLVLQISCTKKGFASSQVMPLNKALENQKYTESLKNNPYVPLDYNNGGLPGYTVLSNEEVKKLFNSIAAVAPYEIKASVDINNLDGIDGKYQKISLKNGFYLELRLQIFKSNMNITDLWNEVSFSIKDLNNAVVDSFAGNMSMYSRWDGKTVSCSDQLVNLGASAKDFIVFSSPLVKTAADDSYVTSILTIGSALTKTTFNIELTCDKDGNMTVRVTK
ncbi:MAG: hypothetical protein FWD71_15285 [Oscillospiraceae bacterium]|nr:hypothetical protein [Oscillospiraceae bacterium]